MATKPKYEDLAAALAQEIFTHYYREQQLVDRPSVYAFDQMYMSWLQIPGGVLQKLGILEPLFPDNDRMSIFVCEPNEFREYALRNKSKGCDYDTLVLALTCIAEMRGNSIYWEITTEEPLLDCLVQLGVCRRLRKLKGPTVITGTEMNIVVVPAPDEPPVYELDWTEKQDFYNELYKDWPSLIA